MFALTHTFESSDLHKQTQHSYAMALVEKPGTPPLHLHEEAREHGWDDEQILEAVAQIALNSFANLVTTAADVPIDGSGEEGRVLKAA